MSRFDVERPKLPHLTPDDIRAGKGPRHETDTYTVEFSRELLAAFVETAWKAVSGRGPNAIIDLRRVLTLDAFDTGEGTVELVAHSREDFPA